MWNYQKNNNINIETITLGSNKKVWWKCDKGHEWQAMIQKRALGEQSCPYCAGNILIQGKNDLATVFPLLAKEWNYEKNDDNPSDYFSVSGSKVWWKCSKCGNISSTGTITKLGHNWSETSRTAATRSTSTRTTPRR